MIIPSLELKWLKPPKYMSLPSIVYGSINGAQGVYYEPSWDETCIDGCNYSLENGLIVVDEDTNISTIAHEFRHHIQFHNGVFENSETKKFDLNLPYEEAICDYFLTCSYEFDAFIYEMKYDINECNSYWFDLLVNKTKNKNLYNLIWRKRKVVTYSTQVISQIL